MDKYNKKPWKPISLLETKVKLGTMAKARGLYKISIPYQNLDYMREKLRGLRLSMRVIRFGGRHE